MWYQNDDRISAACTPTLLDLPKFVSHFELLTDAEKDSVPVASNERSLLFYPANPSTHDHNTEYH